MSAPVGLTRCEAKGGPLPRQHRRWRARRPPWHTRQFPLVLTCAKALHFCETQHHRVASLRRHVPDPQAELHPDTAAAPGIAEGDSVEITTPKGGVRACAAFNDTLSPDVVSGQHGWFEPCEELALPGYPPFGPGSANLNLVLSQTRSDPISGSSPLRAQVCQVTRLAQALHVAPATSS
jgi:anaerobic selenocysteine-containing dehydrogenase